MTSGPLPRARREELLIEDINAEVLIYDLRTRQAHCLNAVAAAIWRACDGETPIDALMEAACTASAIPCDESVVHLALRELMARDLLEVTADAWRPMSRREVFERVAVPAMMLPFITSLAAPTPAMALSCPPNSPQGPQGLRGPQGACDCLGPQGPQGPQGFQAQGGFQATPGGPQGFQGITGFQGDCGPQGPQGPQGFLDGAAQGPAVDECQGPQGFQGPQGPSTCPLF